MKNKIVKILSYVLTALAASAVTLAAVVLLAGDGYTKLEQLEDLIADKFIGQEDQAAIEDAAAEAMVNALGDRWSYYMTAQDYESYKEQMANAYVGIGVTVQLRGDGSGLDVTQVTAGGSAQKAGVAAGDVIIMVDNTDVKGMELTDIRNMIRGEAGTTVILTLRRGEETLKVTVIREQIQTPVATYQMLDGSIGLIKITNFDSRCADETIAAVEALLSQGAKKLIFDVRYNPGGYKKELVEVLDYLLPEGLLFRSESYDGSMTDDNSDRDCLDIPMAVLVNGSSYSAAEFFAAALRDYDWATVVGTQTCGKGYFQNTFVLNDGSAVALSVGKYYTPGGISLAEVGGLTPDEIVEVDDETAAVIYSGTIDPMEDPQILAAIEALNKE